MVHSEFQKKKIPSNNTEHSKAILYKWKKNKDFLTQAKTEGMNYHIMLLGKILKGVLQPEAKER